jgi:hypothetical protein
MKPSFVYLFNRLDQSAGALMVPVKHGDDGLLHRGGAEAIHCYVELEIFNADQGSQLVRAKRAGPRSSVSRPASRSPARMV